MIFKKKCNKENFDEVFLSDNVNFFFLEGKVFYDISVWLILHNPEMGSC